MRRVLAAAICLGLGAVPVAAVAQEFVDRALVTPATSATAHAFAAAAQLYNRRDYAAAIPAFDKVIALQPRFASAITMRGFAYIETGDYTRAMADHDAVLAMAPRSPTARANSCWVRAVANTDLDTALKFCDQAVAIEDDFGPRDDRGLVHFRQGDFAAAVSDYSAALRFRQQASSLFMRGVSRLRLGDEVAGRADIKAAIRQDARVADRYARFGVTP